MPPTPKQPATSLGDTAVVRRAVISGWVQSKRAFYEAALREDPLYSPYLRTLVRGGPVYERSIAYLSALAAAGVRGPATWRIGNARVVSLGPKRAQVEGCLFDTGSVWASTGQPAPPSLGGGPGLTASHAVLVLEARKWLVLSDAVTAVASPGEAGPCRGF